MNYFWFKLIGMAPGKNGRLTICHADVLARSKDAAIQGALARGWDVVHSAKRFGDTDLQPYQSDVLVWID